MYRGIEIIPVPVLASPLGICAFYPYGIKYDL
jgi:hypothetical protein